MRLQTENPEAFFSALYGYFPAVRKFIRAHGGGRDDARDIFQEGLYLFYKKALTPGFELTSKPETFLFGICRMKWMEELRRRGKEAVALADQSVVVMAEEERSAEARIGEAARALERMGRKCRELLMDFYFGNLGMADIAKKMGFSSEDSAKTQKHKCIAAARKLIRGGAKKKQSHEQR